VGAEMSSVSVAVRSCGVCYKASTAAIDMLAVSRSSLSPVFDLRIFPV
jgi:hypothetical protein